MKYGKYIASKTKPEWSQYYLDYKGLKDLIKDAVKDVGEGGSRFSPRTTSLTVQRYTKDGGEERFFNLLEQEVAKVSKFTDALVVQLRGALKELAPKADKTTEQKDKDILLKEAQRIGDDFLQLEKFVNINYMGFHKILKKHDKGLPHAPCRQFYISHLHQQPWVQGNYSDLLVGLSNIYSKLRGDVSAQKNDDSAQGFVRSTTKYWVRNEDCSTVKHHILQHSPVFQFDKDNFSGDAQLINSVYLDNSSHELYHGRLDKTPGALAIRVRWYGQNPPSMVFVERKTHKESWKGEESVKERFSIREDKLVAFLDGEYSLDQALADMYAEAARRGKAVKPAEEESFKQLFMEIFQAIDAKQLRPMIRTQYMRTAFQIPFDATVRVSLDTNLCMIKENPEDGPTCAATGRWFRDPALPIHNTEITRFPHAVLEVKLSLPDGMTSPAWVQELLDSGYLAEVHKFSKFIQGTCTLFPEMVRAVPYWVDDESVRASMLASAASPADVAGAKAGPSEAVRRIDRPATTSRSRPSDENDLAHPLLGDEPTLKLMPDREEVRGFARPGPSSRPGAVNIQASAFMKMLGLAPPKRTLRSSPLKIEPKTFFANERTFLAWLHMAITLGSIAAALLGFASGAVTPGQEGLSRHVVEIISLILLPLGIVIACYALFIFIWRANNIKQKKTIKFDDRTGPLWLCLLVVLALSAITIVSIIDFIELLDASKQLSPPLLPPSPLAPPPFQPPTVPASPLLPPPPPSTPDVPDGYWPDTPAEAPESPTSLVGTAAAAAGALGNVVAVNAQRVMKRMLRAR